jgi:ribokinase
VPAPSIVVVGSANADLHIGVAALPLAGDTVLADDARWLPGGKGANQAAAAARLGADVVFVTAVGDDSTAEVALGGLAADGVDLSSVRRLPGSPSGVAVVCVDSHGENLIVVAPGANRRLEPTDISVPSGCDAVLVSLEIPAAAAEAALNAARAAGALAVLNAAPADECTPALLDLADVVVANEGEAAAIAAGGSLVDLARQCGVTVIATAGPAGVRAATADGTELHEPALPADVVDTVGAGDCFAAAVTVALAEGQDLGAALKFATAAATLKVGRAGARSSPERAEVDALLASG